MKKYFRLFVGALLLAFTVTICACSNSSFDQKKSITTYTRDTSSGTRDGFFTGISFEEAVKDDAKLKTGTIRVDSNGDMLAAIKNDLYGIGYVSLSSLNSEVVGLDFEGVSPTEENVINGKYSLTRNFNYCLRAEYKSQDKHDIVEALIAYMSSIEGEATIKQHGGIVTTKATQSFDDIKQNYKITTKDNSNITINVGGSTSVKSIVESLLLEFQAKCGGFKYVYAPTGSSDAYKRTNGSEKDGANACDLAFASREFKDSEEMPEELKGRMCIDAIVVVVNKNNTVVTNVTKATLKSIYDGTKKTWEEVK